MDEGWTRWVLEQYEFNPTTIHNADIRTGELRHRFDAVILPDQLPREIVDGFGGETIRPEYRGGIGDQGVQNLIRFVADGGTLIALGAASDLALDRLSLPVRNIKRGLRRDEHFAPGTILRLHVDTSQPAGYGLAADTYGFYTNGPIFAPVEGFTSPRTRVVARYAATGRAGVRLVERRRDHGGTRGSRVDRHEPGTRRAVRPAAAASRPDPRDVPAAVQRALPCCRPERTPQGDEPIGIAGLIQIFVTGGTFDKEYNELTGTLFFKETHLPEMLRLGRSRVDVSIRTLLMIDSLDMTDSDRALIVNQCREAAASRIVVTHGTDTMVETARALARALPSAVGKTIRPHGRDGALCLRQFRWPLQPWKRVVVRAGADAWGVHRDERPVLSVGSGAKEPGDGRLRAYVTRGEPSLFLRG